MAVKKKVKLWVIIVGSVVAAIALTALILGLIPINPVKRLPSGYSVAISTTEYEQLPMSDEGRTKVNEGIKGNKFSVLHALLEYKYSYGFKFKRDGDKNRIKYYSDDIVAYKATESTYLLTFSYTTPQTIKVQGETLSFDTVKMRVGDMHGEIEKVDMLFYLNGKVGTSPVDEYYFITPVEVNMAQSKLYSAVKSYADAL